MALKIWLPLNGNLNNQGISDYKFSVVSGPTVNADGKIGSCYIFNGRSDAIYTTEVNLPLASSVALWFNASAISSTTSYLFSLNSDNGETDQQIALYINNTGFAIRIGGGGEFYRTTLNTDTWYHVVLTCDGEVAKFYLNGELKHTVSEIGTKIRTNLTLGARSSSPAGAGTSRSYFFTGKMNDFRIYDECLSPRQVKEIAQGLVSHYKFEIPEDENLVSNSTTFSGWEVGSDWVQGAENGEIYYKCTRTGATTNYWNRLIPTLKLIPANYPDGVSVSFDFKVDDLSVLNKKCICSLQNYDSNNSRVGYVEPDKISTYYTNGDKVRSGQWIRLTKYWTYNQLITKKNDEQNDVAYSMLSFQLVQNGTIYIKKVKCEVGNKTTPWCPNVNDPEYTTLKYQSWIGQDCSGFGYNGKVVGTLVRDEDTPRYSSCLSLDGSKCLHLIPSPFTNASTAFSYAAWFKPYKVSTMCLYSNRTGTGEGLGVFYINSKMRLDSGTDARWTVDSIFPANEWHHIVFTYEATGKKKFYLDGEFVQETDAIALSKVATKASIGISSTGGSAGSSNPLFGNLSDVRIYCTELSAEAVKSLYNTSAHIDNNNSLNVYEFIEGD